jgi:hypothetical protein
MTTVNVPPIPYIVPITDQNGVLNPVWADWFQKVFVRIGGNHGTSGGGAGTVTSVSMSAPPMFAVSGSPVTTTGTLALTYSGTALPLANGGTGQVTQQAAINSLAGATTTANFLRGNGTNVIMDTIKAADVPTLNQNTTGTSSGFTGALSGDVTGGQGATAVNKINGVSLAGLSTGILKNTTSTGVPSIAVAADFPTLNQNTTGSAASFTGSLAGDVSGTQGATVLASVGTAGTYTKVTTDAKGRVTSGTTLSSGDIPNNAANTTGTAANITGTTNNTITTLSSLALPASQITGSVPIAHGGSGQTTRASAFDALSPFVAAGDLIYANAIPTNAALPIGSLGQALVVSGGLPSWGTVPIAGGGTNQTSYTTGDILYASGSTALSKLGIGSSGQVLSVSGGLPAWTTNSSAGVPTGSLLPFAGSSAPTGFLLCDGSAVSRTTYSALFAALSTTYGVGDGSTTFNLPNTQGVFLRGAGSQTISSISYSGTRGTTQGDQMQGHVYGTPSGDSLAGFHSGGGYGFSNTGGLLNGQSLTGPQTDGSNGTPRTGTETRPANISVNYIIKT